MREMPNPVLSLHSLDAVQALAPVPFAAGNHQSKADPRNRPAFHARVALQFTGGYSQFAPKTDNCDEISLAAARYGFITLGHVRNQNPNRKIEPILVFESSGGKESITADRKM
jgi:hypothetical protein